jgi:hypothetical protein
MSLSHAQSRSLPDVADATARFVASVRAQAPRRIEAKVCSRDGMPLLCAVEAILGTDLPRATAQELVWLSGAAKPGAHVLQLQAFGADNQLLAEAQHEFLG